MGTLESIFVTPTSMTTIQLGSVAYDLVYVPVRTAIFLGVTSLAFGLDLHVSGLLPSTVLLLVFVPFVWGLGLVSAAAILTFRRGGGVTGLIGGLLTLGLRGVLPARAAARLGGAACGVESDRDHRGRHATGADRR